LLSSHVTSKFAKKMTSSDLNETWYDVWGQWDIHDDMTFKVIWGQGQCEEMTSVPYRDYFLLSVRPFCRPTNSVKGLKAFQSTEEQKLVKIKEVWDLTLLLWFVCSPVCIWASCLTSGKTSLQNICACLLCAPLLHFFVLNIFMLICDRWGCVREERWRSCTQSVV